MTTSYKQSPLNYIGGKGKLLPQILPLFPKEISTFVDLFCGGCVIGLNTKANKIVFNDNLTYLIEMYKQLKEVGYDYTLEHINNRIKQYDLSKTNTEGFNTFRDLYNKERNHLDLFVLTCFSFNHQIRFNEKHELNISHAKNRSIFNKSIDNNLKQFIEIIQKDNIHFTNEDFNELQIEKLDETDFVFCDPPYLIAFGTYNEKRGFKTWTQKEEYQLLSLLDKLHNNGIKFALSNLMEYKGLKNKILNEWIQLKKHKVNYLNYDYSNSNYHSKNTDKKTVEVLITNY